MKLNKETIKDILFITIIVGYIMSLTVLCILSVKEREENHKRFEKDMMDLKEAREERIKFYEGINKELKELREANDKRIKEFKMLDKGI